MLPLRQSDSNRSSLKAFERIHLSEVPLCPSTQHILCFFNFNGNYIAPIHGAIAQTLCDLAFLPITPSPIPPGGITPKPPTGNNPGTLGSCPPIQNPTIANVFAESLDGTLTTCSGTVADVCSENASTGACEYVTQISDVDESACTEERRDDL